MDATMRKIVGLLAHEKIDRRCAAAMILAELRVKESAAVEALGKCLTEDNRVLQLYALEALASIRSPKVAALITPLLDSPDEEIHTQAAAVLASQGSKAATSLAKELATAPLVRRRSIISILARNHDQSTLERLLKLLSDSEIGEYTLNAMRSEVEHMTPQEVSWLQDRALALLKDKAWAADANGLSRTLRLVGYMRDPKAVRILLPFCAEKNPLTVRIAALAALRRPLQGSAGSNEKAIDALLQYVNDPDPTLARAALDTARSQKLLPAANERLLMLAESRHAEVRAFALEALGRTGNQKVIKSLLAHLGGHDPAAKEAAMRSLARLEGASQALVKELEPALDDPERIGLLCRLLRGHAKEMKPATRQTLTELAVTALKEDRPAATALLDLLSAIDPDGFATTLTRRALTQRKAKRFAEAFALLNRLDSKGLLDEEGQYAALVCGLATLTNKKDLGRASRTTDPVLRYLVALLAGGNNVASKLKKEKALTADDLFYIGFNFSESKDEEEKDFGGALLSHLATTAPRSKLGRSAKNKLRLMGLE